MRPSTRHTSAQQTMVNQHLDFIVNRPRGHSANSVPYLAPPVLANVAAFFAKPLPLGAWPAALPWEHSSRWSYPSPRGSSHSDADHAWVRLPGNGSPLVHRCDKFPIVFRRWRPLLDVQSRPAACVVGQRNQWTWPLILLRS